MAKKTAALATTKPKSTALSTSKLPSYMADSKGAGKGNFNNKDLKLPFLRLAQGTSPALKKNKKLKEGDWYNSLTGAIYGPEVKIVPIVYQHKQMKFEDYNKGGGILCQAPDGQHALEPKGKDAKGKATAVCADCEFRNWGEELKGKKQPPKCDEQGAYAVLVPGESSPMVLIFQKTGFPCHRQLATMINQSACDIYGNQFVLGSTKKEAFLVPTIEADGFADEDTYNKAKSLFDGMAKTFTSAGINQDQVS